MLSLSVNDPGSSFYVSATQLHYNAAGPMPGDPDFMDALEDMVTMSLDDDAGGLAWLDEMNAGPQNSGEFVQDGWTLTWLVETFDVDPGLTAQLSFDMSYFDGGTGEPASSSSPAASFGRPRAGRLAGRAPIRGPGP